MRNLIVLPMLGLVSTVITAHHANVEHDTSVVLELEGQVATLSWRNPHVRMTLNVPAGDGTEQTWDLEAQDVNSLGRRGLRPEMIPQGGTIRVAGHPSRSGNGLYVTNVLLPDGTEIRTRGNTEPRWSTQHIGFDNDPLYTEPSLDVADGSQGIYRVWLRRQGSGFPTVLPLTPEAQAAQAAWTEENDLTMQCIAGGMPGVMTRVSAPHPIDFVQRDGEIVIRIEVFDVVRTVHMNPNVDASSRTPSPLGHSVGRWEGNTLIVRTTQVNWPYFDSIGIIPQSEAVEITERFTLSDDGTRLTYDLEVSDPETFTEPVSARWEFNWRPDMVVERYGCVLDD
ncbi:MAG: DUF6152 family protein [Rhodospirillaceae bacterium]|nr:DUF6152 family protein [Rhodospirillaceae bacterium]